MIWAILGGVICAFVLGAVIGGAICYKDGYDKGVQAVYDYYRTKKNDL